MRSDLPDSDAAAGRGAKPLYIVARSVQPGDVLLTRGHQKHSAAIARATKDNPALAFTAGDGFSGRANEFGIIDLRIAVSAEIMDVMAFGQQELLNLLFVFEAGACPSVGLF